MKFVILGAVARWTGPAAAALAVAVLAATVLAASARYFWVGDLATHFRLQYIVLALLSAVALAGVRWTKWAATAAAALVVNALAVMPVSLWLPEASAFSDPPVRSTRVSLAAINVLYRNADHRRLIEFLRRARPDAALLVEVTPQWRDALGVLETEYPHRYFAGDLRDSGRPGVLLLSRWPIERAATVSLGPRIEPLLRASLAIRGRTLHLIGAHLSWPMGPQASRRRNSQLDLLARLARSTPVPLVVLGDLNVTAFSPHFEALLSRGGLHCAAVGHGWQPTWPTLLPPAGIQIDHALVSADLTVLEFKRGPRIGSDHWPVLITVAR